MANRIVIGVLATCDPSQVERAVAASGLDAAHVRVLTSQEPTDEHRNSTVNFVHVAKAMAHDSLADDMTRGTGVLSDFGGASVPGLNAAGATFDAFSHPEVVDHLEGVEMPRGDAEFYNEAIDDGRCVLICTCDDPSSCDGVTQAVQKAGLGSIRSF
jgi:hypothetical protein